MTPLSDMDALAHQLTKYSLWLLPLVWLILAGFGWRRARTSALCLLVAGIVGTLWNFLFMSVDIGSNSQQYWNAVALVPFNDAPLGHMLGTYLPLVSKASLILAIVTLLRRKQ